MMISFKRETLTRDFLAGMTGAVAGAPQAMGFALIAGISPIYGLYTAIVSTIVGGLFTSSTYMTIGPTNALSLVVGTTLIGFDEAGQLERLFVLTLLVGVFQLVFGLLRLGALTRFVSNAVMTGFITGAGLLIVMGQLSHLNGYEAHGDTVLLRFIDWLFHLPASDPQTTATGLLAIIIIYGLHHTRLRSIATLIAIVATTGMVLVLGWQSVDLVRDMSSIPQGLPGFVLPDLGLVGELVTVAFAMAVLASVQSAAITQSVPEPDGTTANVTRDFSAQGIANIVGAFFQGMPACGSLSRTAVNLSAGAQTRLANVLAGVLVAGILLAFGNLIEQITLAALAGHLVVAALSLIKIENIRIVWRVNASARAAMVATFVATMVLPLEYSIYIGVLLSLGLYIYTSSQNLKVVQLVPTDDHRYREAPIPQVLPKDEPIIISIHGHLYFAAIKQLEQLLPDPKLCHHTVVILRLRNNQYLGSTGVRFLERYAKHLQEHGGKLILSGVGQHLQVQLERTEMVKRLGSECIFYADEVVFNATDRAYEYAKNWLSETATFPAV